MQKVVLFAQHHIASPPGYLLFYCIRFAVGATGGTVWMAQEGEALRASVRGRLLYICPPPAIFLLASYRARQDYISTKGRQSKHSHTSPWHIIQSPIRNHEVGEGARVCMHSQCRKHACICNSYSYISPGLRFGGHCLHPARRLLLPGGQETLP